MTVSSLKWRQTCPGVCSSYTFLCLCFAFLVLILRLILSSVGIQNNQKPVCMLMIHIMTLIFSVIYHQLLEPQETSKIHAFTLPVKNVWPRELKTHWQTSAFINLSIMETGRHPKQLKCYASSRGQGALSERLWKKNQSHCLQSMQINGGPDYRTVPVLLPRKRRTSPSWTCFLLKHFP